LSVLVVNDGFDFCMNDDDGSVLLFPVHYHHINAGPMSGAPMFSTFKIISIEVFGLGGDKAREAQKEKRAGEPSLFLMWKFKMVFMLYFPALFS
jgi:hypothetical protein